MKLFNCKMIGAFAVSLALFMAAGVAGEERTGALADRAVIELIGESGKEGIGIVAGMAQTPEGTLITGERGWGSEDWMIFQDRGGKELGSVLRDETRQSYRCPTALPGGKLTVLRYVFGDDERLDGAYQTLRILDWAGTVILDVPVSVFDRSMAMAGDMG